MVGSSKEIARVVDKLRGSDLIDATGVGARSV